MAELLDRLRSALGERYRLERELGQGGMATVYLAHDLRHDREVAIKVLRPELAATLGPQRFLQEIQIAARLTHPHILPLHDSGEVAGFLYYVMLYVEGESLRDKLSREGELPVAEAVRILKEVTDALAYAHGRGVVHRDIKPENVMLSGRHALVTDFGVAKALHEATGRHRLTTAGVALGTPAYMAPEQAAADPHMDHRADIYAVGAMGYELLTGQPPFTGSSPQMVLAAQVTQQPRPVTDHRPGVPSAMATTIMHCLEKKPADRWQTAAELHAQLEALASTPSGGITPTSTRPLDAVTVKQSSVRTWGKLVAALVILAVMGGGGWYFSHRVPLLVPGRIVVAPFANKTGDPAQDVLGEDVVERLAAAIGGEGMDVAPAAAMDTERRHGTESRAVIARHLSNSSGASIVVTGSYYRRPGGIEYRAELLRMPEGRQVVAIGPSTTDADHPESLDRFVERTLVALAANQESGAEFFFVGITLPASLGSFRESIRGLDLIYRGQPDTALPVFDRALALDTTWVLPRLWAAVAQLSARRFAAVESTLAMVDARTTRLQAAERDLSDHIRAQLRGDWEGQYQVARRIATRIPITVSANVADAALNTNRPLEAISYGKYRDVPTILTRLQRGRVWSHSGQGYSLHMLGRYKEELAMALETRQEFPNSAVEWITMEIQARAGLGQVQEVERLVSESEGLQGGGFWVSSRAMLAGVELAAHGYREAARAMFRRNVEWFRTAAAQQSRHTARIASDSLGALMAVEDYRSTFSAAQSWLAHDSLNADALYFAGLSAAWLGDRATALRMEARLAALKQPYLFGQATEGRAAIVAALGDKGRALDLLRQAYREGHYFGHTAHREPDFEPLHNYPPFREFLRPKG